MLRYSPQLVALIIVAIVLSAASCLFADTAPLTFEWRKFEDFNYLYGTPWSPNNQYLAVASLENDAILLLNRETWAVDKQLVLPDTAAPLRTIQWNPNGSYIAVGNDYEQIVVNVRDGNSIQLTELLSTDDRPVLESRWLDDSNVLAVFAGTGKILLIDVTTKEITQEIELDAYRAGFFYTAFDWNQHSGLFAAPLYSSNTIGFWDESGMMSAHLVQENAPGERRFASQCSAFGVDSSSPLEFDYSGLGGNVDLMDIGWSNGGTRLALTANYSAVVCTLNSQRTAMTQLRQLRIPDPSYDPNSPNPDLQVPFSATFKVSWSPDDHWLLISLLPIPPGLSQNSCGVAVFDTTRNFAYVGKIAEQSCSIHEMSWSPDGRQLAITANTSGYWIGTL